MIFPHQDIFQKAKEIEPIIKNNISQNESKLSNVAVSPYSSYV